MSNASSPCSINDSFIINPKHISTSTLHEERSTTFWRSPFFLSFDMLAMQQLPKQTNTYKNIPISILWTKTNLKWKHKHTYKTNQERYTWLWASKTFEKQAIRTMHTHTHTPQAIKKKKQVSMRFSSFVNIFIPNADPVHPQSSHTPSYKKNKQLSMWFSSFINIFIPNADPVHPQSSSHTSSELESSNKDSSSTIAIPYSFSSSPDSLRRILHSRSLSFLLTLSSSIFCLVWYICLCTHASIDIYPPKKKRAPKNLMERYEHIYNILFDQTNNDYSHILEHNDIISQRLYICSLYVNNYFIKNRRIPNYKGSILNLLLKNYGRNGMSGSLKM